MKHSMKRQQGISFLGLIFYLVLIVVAVTLIVRLGPHYMEYFSIRTVLKDLQDDPDLATRNKRSIKKAVENRLYINDIRHVDYRKFKYKKTGQGILVDVDYETRAPLIANLDVVLKFEHEELYKTK